MSRQKNEDGFFRIGLWSLTALFGIGSGLSVLGLIMARHRGDENALLWLGLLAVTFWFGALLCLALKAFRIVEARKRQHIHSRPPPAYAQMMNTLPNTPVGTAERQSHWRYFLASSPPFWHFARPRVQLSLELSSAGRLGT